MPLSGRKQLKSITEVNGIKYGERKALQISKKYMPGEFILRFDYKEKESSTPYPLEKYIFKGMDFLGQPPPSQYSSGFFYRPAKVLVSAGFLFKIRSHI